MSPLKKRCIYVPKQELWNDLLSLVLVPKLQLGNIFQKILLFRADSIKIISFGGFYGNKVFDAALIKDAGLDTICCWYHHRSLLFIFQSFL
jgi:hypothetical protein